MREPRRARAARIGGSAEGDARKRDRDGAYGNRQRHTERRDTQRHALGLGTVTKTVSLPVIGAGAGSCSIRGILNQLVGL